MVGVMTRRRSWRDLWLAIAGRRTQAEPETVVEVALQDMDLAAFEDLDGRMAYGLQADQRRQRPLWRRLLREPVGL
ncbi:hypothetical protein FHT82_005395 [Rhizobium sp. BK275]|uniref:hypothetical protein n=1 Tax=unclassified Rhizobium TaxID=2613769 RepID=UPI00180C4195|nr:MULTISPECIES: hypothetical protein [unclassified Rhizobium]MBB3392608.1 hypothetical protein [Rhizobium sp. BK275]MBB3408850.1 hypothetical protein [Rhizobium sp. BK316]